MNDDAIFTLSRKRRRLRGLVGLGCPAIFLGFLVSAVLSPSARPLDAATAIGLVVFCGLIAGIPAFIAWRAMTVRVTITRAEVIVRNVVRTKHVPLEEVAGVEISSGSGGGYGDVFAQLTLTPGSHRIPRRVLIAAATTSGTAFTASTKFVQARHAELDPMVDQMNAELDRRRGAPTTAERLQAAKPVRRSIPYED